MGFLNYVKQGLGIEGPDTAKVDTSAASAALDNVKIKSAEELQNEGKNLAGMRANNAGAIAADNARNAMANSGGGKLARALAASQAASNASTDTFNSSLDSSISTAQQQNAAEREIAKAKSGIASQAATQNAANEQAANTSKYGNNITKPIAGTLINAGLSKLFG